MILTIDDISNFNISGCPFVRNLQADSKDPHRFPCLSALSVHTLFSTYTFSKINHLSITGALHGTKFWFYYIIYNQTMYEIVLFTCNLIVTL